MRLIGIMDALSDEVRVSQPPKISLLHTAAVMNPSTECIQKKERKKESRLSASPLFKENLGECWFRAPCCLRASHTNGITFRPHEKDYLF